MPDTPPRDSFRSFTLRVPLSLYVQLADAAHAEGIFLNQKVNQLIKLGMGRNVDINDALARLLKTEVVKEVTND